MCKVSIVLPCYNVASFVAECVDSIYTQEVDNDLFEVVAVIDGSTDNTLQVLEEYQKQHQLRNLRIVTRQNAGVYAARNYGVKIATGEYVWFVDPDDYLVKGTMKLLFMQLEKENVDLLHFLFNRVDTNHAIKPDIKDNFKRETETEVISGTDFLNDVMLYSTYLWSFIVKREVLSSLPFDEKIKAMGDAEYIPRMMLNINKAKMIPIRAYNYVCHIGSISKGKPSQNLIDGAYYSLKTNIEMMEKHPDVIFFRDFASHLAITNIRTLSQTENRDIKIRFFNLLKEHSFYHLSYKGQDKMRKLMVMVFNLSPSLCYNISKHLKRS